MTDGEVKYREADLEEETEPVSLAGRREAARRHDGLPKALPLSPFIRRFLAISCCRMAKRRGWVQADLRIASYTIYTLPKMRV